MKWWRLRCLFLHQRVLDTRSATLHDAMLSIMNAVDFLPAESGLAMQQCLLAAQICFYFHDDKPMKMWIDRAQEISGIEWQVTGALGKRTKFQQQDYAQLVLFARSKNMLDGAMANEEKLPAEVDLNDDTLLERMAITADADTNASVQDGPLSDIDQCLLLSRW